MKVLVACEESQRVCIAFREKGHEAYSCDIRKCSGGWPEWHILMDARAVLNGGVMRLQNGKKIMINRWDLIIAHPPCTYLSNAATRSHSIRMTPINWINARTLNRIEGMRFFMDFVNADCEKIAIENPVGVMNTCYRKPDQTIHPYMFSDGKEDKENFVTKKTCLWLKGLEPLTPTYIGEKPNNHELFGTYKNGKAKIWEDTTVSGEYLRSKTFPGIAKAMAEQWGCALIKPEDGWQREYLMTLPTIEERKDGKWIDTDYINLQLDTYLASCSECGYQMDVHNNRGYFKYCPNCGAKMYEDDKDIYVPNKGE